MEDGDVSKRHRIIYVCDICERPYQRGDRKLPIPGIGAMHVNCLFSDTPWRTAA